MTGVFGWYLGIVSHAKDPEQRHRVRARVPQLAGDIPQPWARPAWPDSRIPALGEQVWIFYEGGDLNSPVYMARP